MVLGWTCDSGEIKVKETIGERPRFSGKGQIYFTLTLVDWVAARGQLRA